AIPPGQPANGYRSAGPDAHPWKPAGNVYHGQLSEFPGPDPQARVLRDFCRIPRPEGPTSHLEPALDQIKVAAATGSQAMGDLSAWRQRRQVNTGVLVDSDHLAAFRPDHLQQPVRALIGGELPLLDLRREARSLGKNTQLQ